jgi:CDP-diacylglycerol--glycerol-3-phosphate 3-phosphatidyltransferase
MTDIIRYIPNTVTLIRILFTGIFIELVYRVNDSNAENLILPITAVFLIICASDFFDGKLARGLHCESAAGAVLDIFADVLFVMTSAVLLNIKGILPVWFTVIITIKFLEFLITSMIIKRSSCNPRQPFLFDRIGRFASAMFIVLPGIACSLYYGFGKTGIIILEFSIFLVSILSIVSSIMRCKLVWSSILISGIRGKNNNENSYNLSK